MKLNLIDCTFRDGGYYNNWDFPRDVVEKYLIAMSALPIEYVEVGFRTFKNAGFKGACAFSTDEYLDSLLIPESLKIAVMVNADELVSHAGGPITAVDQLFSAASNSRVSMVRIASHVHEFEVAISACNRLRELGYMVGMNLMQISDRSDLEIEKIGKLASQNSVDVLYFADSFGGMLPHQAVNVVKQLRKGWSGPLGIHAHDNMGNAIANSLAAANEGVDWIDCTVTGMGRGPGNAQTEYLLIDLMRLTDSQYDLLPILDLIRTYFSALKDKYKWGTNPYYYLSGLYSIHPSYIQSMLGDPKFSDAEILQVIDHLRAIGAKKFDLHLLENYSYVAEEGYEGTWNPSEFFQGKEILILGSGDSLGRYKSDIEALIRRKNLIVIALNTGEIISPNLIQYRAVCNPLKIHADYKKYGKLSQKIIMPYRAISTKILSDLKNLQICDFGIKVSPGSFNFGVFSAEVPSRLAIAYALSAAASGGADQVLLAGFDGYLENDPRNVEMNEVFLLFARHPNAIPVTSVTPTSYKINSQSMYKD